MGLVGTMFLFALGAIIGHVSPRLPTLFMTRPKGFNIRFSSHPEPVELSPYLTQRVLHLRTFYWSSFLLAGIVLFFGGVSLRWGSAGFGFGLWVASSWTILSRLQAFLGGRPAPWTHAMAVELQSVMDASRSEARCCSHPVPVWQQQCIQCSSCKAVLSRIARPDLGRKRSDGWVAGTLRLLITDGHPFTDPLPELTLEQE